MGMSLGRLVLCVAALLGAVLIGGCGAGAQDVEVRPRSSESRHHPVPSHRPSLVEDDRAPVADDLGRLAEQFVSYALGEAAAFPHAESVSLSLGGRPVVSVDDIAAALSTRRIWRICPAGWEVYGAASCPVDLLAPIVGAHARRSPLVYSGEYDDVVCAPSGTGPVPPGRLVVLRPVKKWRTCASDFALVLAADGRGRLHTLDLTLSIP